MVDGSRLGQDEQTPCVPKQAVYRKRHRLNSKSQFESVFNAKLRKSRGPITIFLKVSDAPEHRLGLSIGRRLGNAVVRGRFKRMMREVFRHERSGFPSPSHGGTYDIVVTARKHDPLGLDEYTKLVIDAVDAAHRVCEKRSKK